MGRWHAWLAFAVSVIACGGQSIDDETTGGAAGDVGSGGTGNGGSGNRGGSGNAAGTGGSSAGSGGSSAGTGGNSAGSGGSDVCQLPLVSGSCAAAFSRYGFDAERGHCVVFLYGGCGANGNNFESLAACEARCGGSAESGCPGTLPAAGEPCAQSTSPCHYALSECACAPRGGFCDQIDPNCGSLARQAPPSKEPPCSGADCPSPIVVPAWHTCECTTAGWACRL